MQTLPSLDEAGEADDGSGSGSGSDYDDEEAAALPYELMPSYFTWSGSEGMLKGRKRRGCQRLGRIRWCHPASGELFYLRRLLMSAHGVGACSFEALRTVAGEELPTFKAACVALGMVQGSAEYGECRESLV
eukprot:COSAG01_NODE_28011_length_671_cov_1.424825_2_plen_132_part_00